MRTINAGAYSDEESLWSSLKTAGKIGYATMAINMGANIARMAGYDTGLTDVTDVLGPAGTGAVTAAAAFARLRL